RCTLSFLFAAYSPFSRVSAFGLKPRKRKGWSKWSRAKVWLAISWLPSCIVEMMHDRLVTPSIEYSHFVPNFHKKMQFWLQIARIPDGGGDMIGINQDTVNTRRHDETSLIGGKQA